MRRVAFLGGDAFAVPSLVALANQEDAELVLVACPAERPSGRGMEIGTGPVPAAAGKLGFACERVEDPGQIAPMLEKADLDFCVVSAFGMKLDEKSLGAPRHGCINIHASLLPRWRGAAPVERAILAGDKETGITTMLMAESIDAGKILLQESIGIGADESAGELRQRLADLGAKLIVETLFGTKELTPVAQDADQVTYARKIKKQEALLDWNEDAATLHRKVRAFNPHPGAYFFFNKTRVKVLRAQVIDGDAKPGTLFAKDNDTMTIATGKGCLKLLEIIPAGSKVMSAGAWLRGMKNPPAVGAGLGEG